MENPLLSFSNELAAVVERFGPAVFAIQSHPRAASSGVLWRPGLIVTAEHALRRDDDVHVITPLGEQVKAEVAGRDPGTDIAVLKIPENGGDVVEQFATEARPGNLALAIGRSRGGALTASLGVVSSVQGPWQTWRGGRLDRHVRLDLTVYPGSSGGAVIDAGGRVIGIATAALSRTAPVAVPLETVNRVVDSILAHGTVRRGFIGLGLQPIALPDHLKAKLNLQQSRGLIVVSVHPGGPAETAGAMIGDVLVELAGKPVGDTEDVQQALDSGSVGTNVAARVIRGGSPIDLQVTIGQRPRRSC